MIHSKAHNYTMEYDVCMYLIPENIRCRALFYIYCVSKMSRCIMQSRINPFPFTLAHASLNLCVLYSTPTHCTVTNEESRLLAPHKTQKHDQKRFSKAKKHHIRGIDKNRTKVTPNDKERRLFLRYCYSTFQITCVRDFGSFYWFLRWHELQYMHHFQPRGQTRSIRKNTSTTERVNLYFSWGSINHTKYESDPIFWPRTPSF